MIQFDEINIWSEIKLEIIRDYATEYSKILSNQLNPKLHHIYIDGFAGPGVHKSKSSGEFIAGSPVNALNIVPPFKEYHFVDLAEAKAKQLAEIGKGRSDVFVYEGDCNEHLIKDVFPRAKYENYRRALCVLDPYGLHLDWNVIATAGKMKSIEIFLNFPVMDMNRNALWKNIDKVSDDAKQRMTAFWGDESWRSAAYTTEGNLFAFEEKTDNNTVAQAFRERLKKVAGFSYVPEPLPMRNSNNAIVYYLFFASYNTTGHKIIEHILKKFSERK